MIAQKKICLEHRIDGLVNELELNHRKVLIVDFEEIETYNNPNLEQEMCEHLVTSINAYPAHKRLLLSYFHEGIDNIIWNNCINIAEAMGYHPDNIMTLDCTPPDGKTWRHVYNPMYINPHYLWNPTNERKFKFYSLSRIPRNHRMLFTNELLKRNLVYGNIISCGWYEWDKKQLQLISPEFHHLFPIRLTQETEEDRKVVNWETPDCVRQCIFGIILETAYEKIPGLDKDSMNAILPSEKTAKAYALMQFPIWCTVSGFVKFQRSLGFDVFDDLIDHSYDDIIDPIYRLNAIANEVARLNRTYDLEQMQQLVYDHSPRLLKNRDTLTWLQGKLQGQLEKELREWCK